VSEGDTHSGQLQRQDSRVSGGRLSQGQPGHLQFVAAQPYLVCGRQPCDPHHLRFTQPVALGRKVSDEFTVPLCRGHHRELHHFSVRDPLFPRSVSAGDKIPHWSSRVFRLRRNDNLAAIAFCSNRRRAGMKNVELYGRVRYAVQIEGLSERAAARRFGIYHGL